MITYQKEDFIVMLDSLQELFREYGDMVTPTLLMGRMQQKLHKSMRMYFVVSLYTSLGFVTKRKEGQASFCIIPNLELLSEKRAQFANMHEVRVK